MSPTLTRTTDSFDSDIGVPVDGQQQVRTGFYFPLAD
jgi:hypothetical protein